MNEDKKRSSYNVTMATYSYEVAIIKSLAYLLQLNSTSGQFQCAVTPILYSRGLRAEFQYLLNSEIFS